METKCSQAAQRFVERRPESSFYRTFSPFPPACDRTAFENLPKELRKKIIQDGEQFLGFNFPRLRAVDYMDFKRTGRRTAFENLYFARRRALNSLVLAECAESKGRFMDDIINGIYFICEETAWQLPAHNNYIRDTEQLILPDSSRPVLDLFACETGAQLACILYVLSGQLDEISPYIAKMMMEKLRQRIITPYLSEYFWWMGRDEEEDYNNWTVWCTQNVLLTAFLGDFSENIRGKVLQRASLSCDYFLSGYGDDGCCDEGAQYYRHAGLCLFCSLDIMDQVTGGFYDSLFQWKKIKNIAAYIFHAHAADKYYFNFSDCSPLAGSCGVPEYLFGKRTGLKELMQFAAEDFLRSGRPLYNDEGLNLYHRLITAFSYGELLDFAAGSSPALRPGDIFYPSTGLFIARSPVYALAVKAGDNGDSHNHNDTGSFTLYQDGNPLFIDIGVESYTKKTFSPRRYEIWTMQSCYHNLPTIDGTDQKDGAAFGASLVETSFQEDSASISMELTGAYLFQEGHPPTADASEPFYLRKVVLQKKENRVEITDRTNCKNVVMNLITYEKPVPGQAGEIKIGSLGYAGYQGARLESIEALPVTDPKLQIAWKHDIYRIRLALTGECFFLSVTPLAK